MRVREEMTASGRSFREVINDLLRLGLTVSRRAHPEPPFQVRSRRLGLRPGLSYDNISELLEYGEGPRHG